MLNVSYKDLPDLVLSYQNGVNTGNSSAPLDLITNIYGLASTLLASTPFGTGANLSSLGMQVANNIANYSNDNITSSNVLGLTSAGLSTIASFAVLTGVGAVPVALATAFAIVINLDATQNIFEKVKNTLSDPEMISFFVEHMSELISPFEDFLDNAGHSIGQNLPLPNEISTSINDLLNAAINWVEPPRRDPLVLDLDGDGIETTAADGTVNFDHDGDGVKNGTGWISADDGILVLDRNGNGLIDNGGELFGDNTLKADGTKALNGFDALAELDTNNDGKVDAADAQFSELRIWQDFNQDGISQSNELSTLTELGIQSIGTQYISSVVDVGNDNISIAQGGYIKTDGTDGNAGTAKGSSTGSLDLAVNNFFREFTDTIAIPEALQALPDMQGSGAVRDLKQASALSPELAALLGEYSTESSATAQLNQLDGLLIAWANSANFKTLDQRLNEWNDQSSVIYSASNGSYAEGIISTVNDRLQVLEVFNNQVFATIPNLLNTDGTLRLSVAQQNLIDDAYNELRDSVYNGLLVETRLKPYLEAVTIDLAPGTELFLNFEQAELLISQQAEINLIDALQDAASFKLQIQKQGLDWDSYTFINAMIEENPTGFTNHELISQIGLIVGTSQAEQIIGSDFGEVIIGLGGNDTVTAGAGNDVIYGGAGADLITVGFSGSNQLNGDAGDDVLRINQVQARYQNHGGVAATAENTFNGGTGNDRLEGWTGADTYLFNRGDGQDTIRDYAIGYSSAYRSAYDQNTFTTVDRIVFGENIAVTDVTATREGNNLVLLISDENGLTGDKISIEDAYSNVAYRIEELQFSNGTSLNTQQIFELAAANIVEFTNNDDVFNGTEFVDQISGLDGNDILNVGNGDNLVLGGAGNDSITAGTGADQIDGGEGNDTIIAGAGNDDIQGGLGDDILHANHGDDVVSGGEGADLITADYSGSNHLNGDAGDDTLRINQVQARYQNHGGVAATAENTFNGGTGNDRLEGWTGADTYLFNRGDGQDTIRDYAIGYNGGSYQEAFATTDRIILGEGILREDVTIGRDGDNIVLSIEDILGDSEDQITFENAFSDSHYKIEEVVFADGTVLVEDEIQSLAAGNDINSNSILNDSLIEGIYVE